MALNSGMRSVVVSVSATASRPHACTLARKPQPVCDSRMGGRNFPRHLLRTETFEIFIVILSSSVNERSMHRRCTPMLLAWMLHEFAGVGWPRSRTTLSSSGVTKMGQLDKARRGTAEAFVYP